MTHEERIKAARREHDQACAEFFASGCSQEMAVEVSEAWQKLRGILEEQGEL